MTPFHAAEARPTRPAAPIPPSQLPGMPECAA